jgi:Uma2 family endonuclease
VVRNERLQGIDPDRGYMPIPADLVVEVISPNDFSYEVVAKVREYLSAGFPLIWVIHPNVRNVTVYSRGQHSPMAFEETDEITAEPALAGFRCKVAAFFE